MASSADVALVVWPVLGLLELLRLTASLELLPAGFEIVDQEGVDSDEV